ncbi:MULTISPECIES: hypothetical protein [Paenibacillaceae]|uniref:hypothetical protein n=1 Tax=Paenibacillaceae TaxID=186822 RepID=UPI00129AFAEC|nr:MULTISPECIES: hypothetical protein [Paenibacillaceae]MCC3372195.1 hypothetical protein [Cohnella sp. REN36]QGG55829.1 hypothetical protein GE073_09745 [Paenibacillus sp. B01]
MKIKITALAAALVIAGCSTHGNERQTNDNQTDEGQQNEMGSIVAKSPSCEIPPQTIEWAGKKYGLKEKNTSAEPVMKLGYVSCEGGKFKKDGDNSGTLVVYNHGDPRTNHDLIFAGKWGLTLYTMSQQ